MVICARTVRRSSGVSTQKMQLQKTLTAHGRHEHWRVDVPNSIRRLPALDGEYVRWTLMPVDHLRLDHRFQVHMLPVRRSFLEQRVKINRVVKYLAGGFRTLLRDTSGNNDRLPCNAVVDASHNGVIT